MRIPLNIISDGGLVFMVPLLLFIGIILVLFILAMMSKERQRKLASLIAHISLFALIWGLLGSVIGLIQAFDSIQSAGEISGGMMAGGLKIALITTLFGLGTFLIGRFALILITLNDSNK